MINTGVSRIQATFRHKSTVEVCNIPTGGPGAERPQCVCGIHARGKEKKSEDGEIACDIDTLTGIAMGCMGMSFTDFCSFTPFEFNAVYKAWNDEQERMLRQDWEQTRIVCQMVLSPYCKRRLKAKDVFPLPWDNVRTEEPEEISKEERAARYKAAKKRYGIE